MENLNGNDFRRCSPHYFRLGEQNATRDLVLCSIEYQVLHEQAQSPKIGNSFKQKKNRSPFEKQPAFAVANKCLTLNRKAKQKIYIVYRKKKYINIHLHWPVSWLSLREEEHCFSVPEYKGERRLRETDGRTVFHSSCADMHREVSPTKLSLESPLPFPFSTLRLTPFWRCPPTWLAGFWLTLAIRRRRMCGWHMDMPWVRCMWIHTVYAGVRYPAYWCGRRIHADVCLSFLLSM